MGKSSTSGRKRIIFELKATKGCDIYLAGTFNNWDSKTKKMKDTNKNGVYTATLLLHPGEYEYKFLVNGEWHVDPACPNWTRNDHGTLNSVVTVKK